MPIVVSNEGWVKLPPPPPRRKPAKPVNPVNAFRGPLAYIAGRPEFKEPVKKQSIKQLLIEAAPPTPPPIIEARGSRHRDRVASAPLSSKSKHRAPTDIVEVEEEIISPHLRADDLQSRRSASPAASRHTRAAPSVRSRRHEPPRSIYDDDQEDHRHSRSKRHVSVQQSYYDDDSRQYRSHRSDRSERSYHRERSRDRYRSDPYMHNYSTPHLPQIQPIVIYSTPPQPQMGCGGHHSCHGNAQYQQQYYAAPTPMLQATPTPAALPAPRPPPSEVSSRSSGSKTSRAMSYKWYTATQPLAL
ncbi:hypothetical protein LTR70_008285 [Exophiala xenobiotica]|uniref:Uncharacterized protein n=1 Tax=Lithohypha guttulata TaxID=1690604 RepID=A0ABR0K3A2_9EURO|nr:hypothetical protein LTR24_007853 [Lithohypha guttulata]KAK5312270.1 hypothetical protein LTR70_008285 [Exophiala xenobiotica]